MAAFNRPTNATYLTHDNVTVDTLDNEDHTFCGIMFPIKCKDLLPVDHLVIKSVSVRGYLGPLTVWVSKKDANYDVDRSRRSRMRGLRRDHTRQQEDDGEYKIPLRPSSWIKLYEKTHDPCPRGYYTELVLNEPIILRPGEMRALYIHSTLPNDQAIVYDNSYYGSSEKRYEDDKLCILTGRAHVSPELFGQNPIWGWGNAWRDRREFVGRLAYGTVYKLWNPEVQPKFGGNFQNGARSLFLCQRRWESPMSMLPDEALFYILNMCRWDWFDDSSDTMKDRRKREKERKEKEKQEALEAKPAASTTDNIAVDDEKMDVKPSAKEGASARCGCSGSSAAAAEVGGSKTTGMSDDEEDDDDDEDEEYVETSDDGDSTNDANMEVEVVEVDEDMNDTEDADYESDESEDEDDYHRANRRYFGFQYPDSDEEEDEDEKQSAETARNAWFHRRFARIHVLRALAAMEDEAIDLEL